MSKQYPTYEEIQRKKKRQQNIAIGAYIAVVMALIAAVTFFLGGM
jgi:flagellar basal body-associated protein FliL